MIDTPDFKNLPNYMDIVRAIAKSRRDAWNAASRESSDIIDAEIFLASVQATLLAIGNANVSPLPESQPTTEPSSSPVEPVEVAPVEVAPVEVAPVEVAPEEPPPPAPHRKGHR
jgi:hypothetical protein